MQNSTPFSGPQSEGLTGGSGDRTIGAAAATKSASGESSSDAATIADPSPLPAGEQIDNLSSITVFAPGTLMGARYQIMRILGQGGMGAVYQARDQELDRVIALKVIRPELAANPSILQRFKQELILSRHVTHKNVVRIFDLGEADGIRFITMEYVEGEDLRGLLRRQGKFSAGNTVTIIQQICRALEAAHAEGVIHRDLKPQNVMRDPQGRVVVMDFGLARSLESDGMTQTGALVGTLEYMSPEQALGATLDPRSDLFAVGLIFYELLTGKAPYKADTAIASLMKRTHERAIPASDVDASVPVSLSVIVSRCLERDPKDRYQSAPELLAELEAWSIDPLRSVSHASVISSLATAKTPTSWAAGPRSVQINLNLPGRQGWIWAAAAIAIISLFFALPVTRHMVFRHAIESGPGAETVKGIPNLSKGKYIAVLPLKVLGDKKSLGYVADGLMDALSAKMFQLQSVRVASSAAVEKATSNDESITNVARALGVNLILQGTVMGSPDKLRITFNLENVSDNRRLWTQEFSGVTDDLLTLEDQIYTSLVQALEVRPSDQEMAMGGVHPTENVKAYDLYLKGRDALRGTQGTRDLESAIHLFENALREDPGFALAYTGLADADLRLYKSSKEPLYAEKAVAAAQKAASLNAVLPEVHLSLGSVYNATGKSAEAITELKKALALSPNSDEAYRRLGEAHRTAGHKAEAIAAYQSAVNANPYYWSNHNTLGGAYFQFGENDKALREYQKVSELAPDNPIGYQNTGAVYFRLGKWDDSITAFQKSLNIQPDATIYANIGTAYFFLKRYDDSVKMFEKAVELSPKDEQLVGNLADAYRAAGRKDQATATYDKAIQLAFQQLQVNPKLASVTGDLALYYAKKGDVAHALQYARQARALDHEDLQLLYYQAEIFALANQQKEALTTLRQAFRKGYSPEEAQNDPELASLKSLPEFTKLVAEYSGKKN
jgi:serine/threonine protein kinase/tetratricopeptide (TPR) repeat protein/TolB-like protein